MDRDALLQEVEAVFRDVFEDDELKISAETKAEDVDGWDSLMHVSLMINVERVFGVKFSASQVASLKDVGELVNLLESRLAAKGAGGRA